MNHLLLYLLLLFVCLLFSQLCPTICIYSPFYMFWNFYCYCHFEGHFYHLLLCWNYYYLRLLSLTQWAKSSQVWCFAQVSVLPDHTTVFYYSASPVPSSSVQTMKRENIVACSLVYVRKCTFLFISETNSFCSLWNITSALNSTITLPGFSVFQKYSPD